MKGRQMLLARSPHFPPGIYSALAGYLEAGESLEHGLKREIREEAGIEIHNIHYLDSQSWPYPHSLMIGFIADYLSGELHAQESEIEDLDWFDLDNLPVLPHRGSLAYRMIGVVCERMEGVEIASGKP
jgi:NAD+ diphosphatase